MKKLLTGSTITLLALLVFNQALAEKTAGSQSEKARAAQEGWPDTPAGLTAFGWVEAFNSGEQAMQQFLADHLTKTSLAERSMAVRMASYNSLLERYGALMFTDTAVSKPLELTATIMAEDTSQHRFIFKVEEEEPHKLTMVGIVQSGHGSGRH